MKRSSLQNKLYKNRSAENSGALKKQKDYRNRIYKRERGNYYSQLNLRNIAGNKKFWNTVNPLIGNKGGSKENIVLVNGNEIISDDTEVAQTFNDFFKSCVSSLDISENKLLLTETNDTLSSVDEAIQKFEKHPSISSINENVKVDQRFSFSEITVDDIRIEIKNLNSKKAGTFMNIPAKQLKQAIEIVDEPLMTIWNEEMVQHNVFSKKLKLADITPVFKKLEHILVDNYRPVHGVIQLSRSPQNFQVPPEF